MKRPSADPQLNTELPGSRSYDARFYRYIQEGSERSANIVATCLYELLPCAIHSVLDVGCGTGAWLTAFKKRNCRVFGVDGAHVRRDMLQVESSEFGVHDLAQPFTLDTRFDLVLCLEVAEHLPTSSAAGLVASLCRHGDVVVFSAAPPGQGGALHVNERPFAFWRDLFSAHGFRMYDPVRKVLLGTRTVKHWYRYNTFVYVSEATLPEVHRALAPYAVDALADPADVSPWSYRCRKVLVRLLPVALVSKLADMKKYITNLVTVQ